VVWQSSDELRICSKRQWSAIFLLALVMPLMAALVCLTVLGVIETTIVRPNALGAVCFGAFCLLTLGCFCLMSFVVLRALLIRHVRLDIREQRVHIRQIPGFSNSFLFSAIKSVDLLRYTDRGTAACHLCVTLNSQAGLVWFVSSAGYESPAYYEEQLLPLAQLLAQLFCCPIEISQQRISSFSIAKWPNSSRAFTGNDTQQIVQSNSLESAHDPPVDQVLPPPSRA